MKKTNVFTHDLNVLESNQAPINVNLENNYAENIAFKAPEANLEVATEPIVEEEVVKDPETLDIAWKTEPRVSSLALGMFDRLSGGIVPANYVKTDGTLGLYKDRPDPITVQRNAIRRAGQYTPNKISNEIEKMDLSTDDKKYLKLLQHLEGGSNYKIVNDSGYMGLYQFGKPALKTIKMDLDDYMSNSMNQHIAALKLKDFNLKKLGLDKYIGKTVGGITLTENGLAAGQHLGGAGSVKKFLESNGKLISVDQNNLPITAYLTIFQ